MDLELAEALDQFRKWSAAESIIRITKEGTSWLSPAHVWSVSKDAILVGEEGSMDTTKIGNLGAADFRRVEGGIDAVWPTGATVHFREESLLT
jgi:hypothetical protein